MQKKMVSEIRVLRLKTAYSGILMALDTSTGGSINKT